MSSVKYSRSAAMSSQPLRAGAATVPPGGGASVRRLKKTSSTEPPSLPSAAPSPPPCLMWYTWPATTPTYSPGRTHRQRKLCPVGRVASRRSSSCVVFSPVHAACAAAACVPMPDTGCWLTRRGRRSSRRGWRQQVTRSIHCVPPRWQSGAESGRVGRHVPSGAGQTLPNSGV